MRNIAVCIIGCFFGVCAVRAQEAPVDQQFKVLSAEVEGWKKEMTRAVASRTAVEPLLRLGVAFQKSYADADSSIVKADLLDEYVRKRDAQMWKLPITLYKCAKKDISLANPGSFVFQADELEIDPARPLFFLLNGSQDRMLYSYKESQQFINLLGHLMAKAKANEQTSIPTRHFMASVQPVNGEATMFFQFLTPEGSVSKDMYRLSEFDAKLLANRIGAVLKASPPPKGYREPDDVDPGTTMFATPADSGVADIGSNAASALVFSVARVKVSQGRKQGNTNVSQQFEYRVTCRWNGDQPVAVRLVMYLVSEVDSALAVVGKEEKAATLEPKRLKEVQLIAEQKVPGPSAGTVIVQCFAGGTLLKGWSSSAQHKKYADMEKLESQLQPLYQDW